MKSAKVVLKQNGQAKIQADNVSELVKALYKGLKLQNKVGKRNALQQRLETLTHPIGSNAHRRKRKP